jgi:nucleoside 2-deoxyribosyltransferase
MVMASWKQPIVYISGPLHAARDLESARMFYEYLAQVVSDLGWTPYLPHQTTDPHRQAHLSAEQVFVQDLGQLVSANAVIADIGQPSSGVGAELGIVCERGIPVVALHAATERPSRFVLGMLLSSPSARVITYLDRDDCRQHLWAALIEVAHEAAR